MIINAHKKYGSSSSLAMPARKWPERTLAKPPRWLATDLRDGNQALPEPMTGEAKLDYFQTLLQLGYKEIEIAYPSASDTEFNFTRTIATTTGLVPDDVWIQVMAPCREDLIRRTIESVRGAHKVIVHLHISTSECFRRIVFNKTEDEMVELAVRCSKLVRELTKDSHDEELRRTEWTYEFTAENFQDTSVAFAVRICEAVKAAWEPTEQNKIIFNLPSTVEVAMPNVFADQIELFCESITEREKCCVSLHTHNDRGCAVATAELAQLAGADRVEGCLFGNGERTGNVDLVTLALNLYTNGIHPGIDFGSINDVVALVEEKTGILVHSRAPYAGKFTFCTFTGTHQDAIRKGYTQRGEHALIDDKWEMPYLPMDPEDLGRKHEAIIRVTSQSGKGGVAWLVKQVFGVEAPSDLALAFTVVVQEHANLTGSEVSPDMIRRLFEENYMASNSSDAKPEKTPFIEGARNSDTADDGSHTILKGEHVNEQFVTNKAGSSESGSVSYTASSDGEPDSCSPTTLSSYSAITPPGTGSSTPRTSAELISGAVKAANNLGFTNFDCLNHEIQLVNAKAAHSTHDQSASFVKLGCDGGRSSWGVAIHENPAWACLQAVLTACAKLMEPSRVL